MSRSRSCTSRSRAILRIARASNAKRRSWQRSIIRTSTPCSFAVRRATPEKFHGDKVKRIAEYGDDEKNTESVTNLQVHVGGGGERPGIATGIHWHMNLANEIEYIATDDKRQVIPYVRLTDRSGNVREYVTDGETPEQLAKGERRRMDCMDCHNRPAHTMAATAERAVNAAMARSEIPATLPFVHREAVRP
jgi:hypothetical protein